MNKHSRVWQLQEAKARFSEVVRLAQSEGPQLISVRGETVAEVRMRPKKSRKGRKETGLDLWKALSQGPQVEIEIPEREKDGVFRDIDL